jgi:hypothetical protein
LIREPSFFTALNADRFIEFDRGEAKAAKN